MIVAHIEVSKEKGLMLIVYNHNTREGIYGIEIKPSKLDDAIEKGVCYKVYLDSLVKVEQIKTEEPEDVEIVEKAIDSLNPFHGDENIWKEIKTHEED